MTIAREIGPLLRNSTTDHAIYLLTHYGFDLQGYSAERLVNQWSEAYPVHWIRPAVIEALYQGRYKAVSVVQILVFWQRREQPLCHFSHEFERIICSDLPKNLVSSQVGVGVPPEPIAEIHLPDPGPTSQPSAEAPAVPHSPTPPVGPSLEAQTAQLERLRSLIERFASGKLPVSPSPFSPSVSLPEHQNETGSPEYRTEEDLAVSPSEAKGGDRPGPICPIPSPEGRDETAVLEAFDSPNPPLLDPPPFAEAPPPEAAHYSEPQGYYTPDFWLAPESEPPTNHPIHQFIPASSPGEGYDKLRSVLRGMG